MAAGEEEVSLFRVYLDTEKMELERLMHRPRRLLLADSLSAKVRESDNPQVRCVRIVQLALDIHTEHLKETGGICRLDNYHCILYVAAKMCTDWKIGNTQVVCALLQALFLCEQTFEKLLVSAIFGLKISHYYTGWRSDYEKEEDNLSALEYFLSHSTLGREMFVAMGSHMRLERMRFLEVAMESYNRAMPLYVTAYVRNPESLLLLLRFGAPLCRRVPTEDDADPPVVHILKTLSNHHSLSQYPKDWILCLKYLMRAVPRVHIRTNAELPPEPDTKIHQSNSNRVIIEVHPRVVLDGLLPLNRYLHPTELKHLCRCVIRQKLNEHWGLPHAIGKLSLPKTLRTYLDLLED